MACKYWQTCEPGHECCITVEGADGDERPCGNMATHLALGEMDEFGQIYPDRPAEMKTYGCRRHVREYREWASRGETITPHA